MQRPLCSKNLTNRIAALQQAYAVHTLRHCMRKQNGDYFAKSLYPILLDSIITKFDCTPFLGVLWGAAVPGLYGCCCSGRYSLKQHNDLLLKRKIAWLIFVDEPGILSQRMCTCPPGGTVGCWIFRPFPCNPSVITTLRSC